MFRQQQRALIPPYKNHSKGNVSFSLATHKCPFRRRFHMLACPAIFSLLALTLYYTMWSKGPAFTCVAHLGENQSQNSTQSFARIILFQRGGGHQLRNFMAYYSKVLPLKDIVIIDHQTAASKLNIKTSGTQGLLKQYNSLGSDVWQCEGDFRFKGKMWSHVANQYALQTDYIFPLDIDEFIAIPKNDGTTHETLTWNMEAFKEALDKLPENTGKPFKIEIGKNQPLDCPDSTSDQKDAAKKTGESLLTYHKSGIQQIQYFLRRESRKTGCRDKSFFRGHEFKGTDDGNHYGITHDWSENDLKKLCLQNNRLAEEETLSGLVLMHVQFIDFNEWFLHKLRGASDRGFNKYKNLVDCKTIKRSSHYCVGWEEIHGTNFDPRKLKNLYYKNECSLRKEEHWGYSYRVDVRHLFRNEIAQ